LKATDKIKGTAEMFSFLKIKKRKYLHPMAYMKGAQAKGEAFSPQKRSST
jgi:hypothetical protein